ncbi:MAG: radical SAM family heme chaperone HemW [Opitutae bacterium]|nr:radical SAM family heme chaperone HemW [Opitutae bacterium]
MAETTSRRLGLYCHIPFCASSCDFCAFYREKPYRSDLESYLDGMEEELDWMEPDRPFDTIFWGGGTPTLLPAKDLERLGRAVVENGGGRAEEWTVEMAPSTVKPDKLEVLKALGVNRISMGVQSFNEHFLEILGRRHGSRQVYQAYDWIRQAGFTNVNLDLMIALPGQGLEDLLEDLEEACQLEPDHLSAYGLTFEEDTVLWAKLAKGELRRDEDREADLYEAVWDFLPAHGYHQYEISNFCRPGFHCRHNLDTWRMKEWIGVGPAAASQHERVRYSNAADLPAWLGQTRAEVGDRHDVRLLTDSELLEDAVIFGLRMDEGVSINELSRRFPNYRGEAFSAFFEFLKGEGLATIVGGDRVKLTRSGKLLTDRIGVAFLNSL